MAIKPHVPIAMAELISCNNLCSEFSQPGSYYICHLCTQLVLHLQDAVTPVFCPLLSLFLWRHQLLRMQEAVLQLVICALFSGTSVSVFMGTNFNISHDNVPKIAKFHTNIKLFISFYKLHLLPLLLKILSRLYPPKIKSWE